MAKITIDNKEVECRDGITVLQAALEAGWDIPHYCYHPGLSIVASCRLCLMEMQMPHPKTGEMDWAPKLLPSCQTPVKDGMVVRFNSETVKKNQRDCMEFFLLNHPLDCPVCDQAGECYLQDYSYRFGRAESRMVDQKTVNPKKDIGPRPLLYSDRCVICSRCVRFTREISGTFELHVTQRGSRSEIDVFPGRPLDNPVQGNVVDICPVGALLDKDFLFKKRAWEFRPANSICPGCARGCSIRIDQDEDVVYRLKPRYNPKVNDWWICDEGRFGYKYIHDESRVKGPILRRGQSVTRLLWEEIPDILRFRFQEHVEKHGGDKVAAVLSPFMACEEAWLLGRFIREMAPQAALAMGPVPLEDEDQRFPVGAKGEAVKFEISKEKCPNRRGVEAILEQAGGTVLAFEDFIEKAGADAFSAAWIVGGYPKPWLEKAVAKKLSGKSELLVVQDIFPNDLMAEATFVLPACSWAEREGCFMNIDGLIQPFDWAIHPPDGVKRDGQYLFEIAGYTGLYSGKRVRELMAATMPAFAEVLAAPQLAAHAH
ncbi:MAG: (2Fe-2S)-binding protein [Phycisphaerales bacterium]|nr:MAG: (2Fe-2S)-binding protein [Phycisphaerales bacterium]